MNFAVLASAIGLLGACAHKPPPPPPAPCAAPEPIRILISASPRLNLGENGESLATTVRVYQLKDTAKLVESSIDRILDNDRAVLAEDFVSMQELILYPGERAAPPIFRGEGAVNIAVVAMFRRPEGPSWRAIRKLPLANPDYCRATPQAQAASQLQFSLEDSRVVMR